MDSSEAFSIEHKSKLRVPTLTEDIPVGLSEKKTIKLLTDIVQIQKRNQQTNCKQHTAGGYLLILLVLEFPYTERLLITHTAPPCRPTPSCCDGSSVDATWAFDRLRGTKKVTPWMGVGVVWLVPRKGGWVYKDLGVVLLSLFSKKCIFFGGYDDGGIASASSVLKKRS